MSAPVLLSSLRSEARYILLESTANFWSDAELLTIIQRGITDLWGAIVDLHQEHFLTIDVTTAALAASTSTLTLASNIFRIVSIEPRDTSSTSSNRYVTFEPKEYSSAEMQEARAMDAQDPSGPLTIYYSVTGVGEPTTTPVIYVAPQITSAMDLRCVYIFDPHAGNYTASSTCPIPGGSDQALIAWTVAYARAKEREDRSPDPTWLQIYATEKQGLLTRLTPRQEQEPDVVEDIFGAYWN